MKRTPWARNLAFSGAITFVVLVAEKVTKGQFSPSDFGIVFVISLALVFASTAIINQLRKRKSIEDENFRQQ